MMLSTAQQRQIRKNLRQYSRIFDQEDSVAESHVSAELIGLRKRQHSGMHVHTRMKNDSILHHIRQRQPFETPSTSH